MSSKLIVDTTSVGKSSSPYHHDQSALRHCLTILEYLKSMSHMKRTATYI